MKWSAPIERNGIVKEYKIFYQYPERQCSSDLKTVKNNLTTNSPSTYMTLDSGEEIYPYWNYNITVAAVNSIGTGGKSSTIEVTTDEYGINGCHTFK